MCSQRRLNSLADGRMSSSVTGHAARIHRGSGTVVRVMCFIWDPEKSNSKRSWLSMHRSRRSLGKAMKACRSRLQRNWTRSSSTARCRHGSGAARGRIGDRRSRGARPGSASGAVAALNRVGIGTATGPGGAPPESAAVRRRAAGAGARFGAGAGSGGGSGAATAAARGGGGGARNCGTTGYLFND